MNRLSLTLGAHAQYLVCLFDVDISLLLSDAASHRSQTLVQQIASSQEGSWPKLWDLALERGVFETTCIQAVLKFLSLHPHSDNTCPIPNCGILLETHSICSHFLSDHSELTVTTQEITDACICYSDSIFIFGRSLHNSFKSLLYSDLHLPSTSCKPRANEILCYVMLCQSVSVYDYSRIAGNEAASERYQQLSSHKRSKIKLAILIKRRRSRSALSRTTLLDH